MIPQSIWCYQPKEEMSLPQAMRSLQVTGHRMWLLLDDFSKLMITYLYKIIKVLISQRVVHLTISVRLIVCTFVCFCCSYSCPTFMIHCTSYVACIYLFIRRDICGWFLPAIFWWIMGHVLFFGFTTISRPRPRYNWWDGVLVVPFVPSIGGRKRPFPNLNEYIRSSSITWLFYDSRIQISWQTIHAT